ncbi:hypothetical protein INT44_005795 [Umbelopsis vinacea]|uniref:Uncharacterized protein n=1 Tax=Umbelopsis vinacea TaxID=44442 RepID=A0A8H7PZL9_9FUNG|nr:hypothetical protein INT44_005795 [Umbelopsis vinacea]
MEAPLKRATAQQLYRIEKCNPHITEETQDLWIPHCLTFRDMRIAYEAGNISLDTNWRETYLERHEENQRKRQLIGAKIKSHYNQIQNEKEARSTKFINKAILPSKRRVEHSFNHTSKRTRGNSLFAKTMHAARQEAAIYHSHDNRRPNPNPSPRHINTTVIRIDKVPSALQMSYSALSHKEPIQLKPPPILKPPPPVNISQRNVIPAGLSNKAMKDPSVSDWEFNGFTIITMINTMQQTKYYVPSHSASKVESLKRWPMDKPLEKVGMEDSKQKNAKAAKDSAIVNFGIFKELSGH